MNHPADTSVPGMIAWAIQTPSMWPIVLVACLAILGFCASIYMVAKNTKEKGSGYFLKSVLIPLSAGAAYLLYAKFFK